MVREPGSKRVRWFESLDVRESDDRESVSKRVRN